MKASWLVALVMAVSASASAALAQDTSAAPAAGAQEPEAIGTVGFPDGTQFATAFESKWTIGRTHVTISIPDGFVTDFASIPPELQFLLKTQGTYSRAAVIHDYLYWTQSCTRAQSDNLLMIAMIESHVPWAQRQAIYQGVHRGGAGAWAANAQDKAKGLGKFVPAAYRSRLNTEDWTSLRKYLVDQNIHDPVTTISPAICALGNSAVVP